MTSCPATAPAPLRCPTLTESMSEVIARLPFGRAWPANDGGGMLARFLNWLSDLNGAVPARDAWPPGYVQTGFFAAIGAFFNFIESRLCDLRFEFWCATHKETHAEWMKEYGLPDACDAFPDLCTKVAALGGSRCEYFQEVAARSGWVIECIDLTETCGDQMGCAVMGCSQMGAARTGVFKIIVHLGRSPSYGGGPQQTPAAMGLLQMGMPISCPPNITPLECIIDRIAPAHVEVVYVTAV